MSNEAILTLVAVACAIISITCFDYVRRALNRCAKQKEEEQAAKDAEQQIRRQMMAKMLERYGVTPVSPIAVTEIKNGEEVCWISPETGSHEHYTAGYDGDPGPSADGVHCRKISPEGQ